MLIDIGLFMVICVHMLNGIGLYMVICLHMLDGYYMCLHTVPFYKPVYV